MRILVVGATGTIGGAVTEALVPRGHHVVRAAATHGDLAVDMADPRSIENLYGSAGPLDAVVCAVGRAEFGPAVGAVQLQLALDDAREDLAAAPDHRGRHLVARALDTQYE